MYFHYYYANKWLFECVVENGSLIYIPRLTVLPQHSMMVPDIPTPPWSCSGQPRGGDTRTGSARQGWRAPVCGFNSCGAARVGVHTYRNYPSLVSFFVCNGFCQVLIPCHPVNCAARRIDLDGDRHG